MKSTELRLGNLIDDSGIPSIINNFDEWGISVYDANGDLTSEIYRQCGLFKPIPLTEEWLIKFGFESWGKDEYGYVNYVLHNVIDGTSNFVIGLSDDNPIPMIDNNLCCWSEFKYVHTLQNLYFALTGEELKIKDI
jgi:hypothetical protein